MGAFSRALLLFVTAIMFVSSSPLSGAVSFALSGSNTNLCPGTTSAPLGALQLATTPGGLVSTNSSIIISLNHSVTGPLSLTGTPSLTGAPGGVTFSAAGSQVSISIPFNTTFPAGSSMIISGMLANAPSTEGSVVASASFSGDLTVSPNVQLVAMVTTTGCIGRIATSLSELGFGGPVGSIIPAQTFTITNGSRSGMNLGITLVIIYVSGTPGWLTVQQGAESGGITNVTAQVSTAGLFEGTYTATLRIMSSQADNSPVDLPVTLKLGKTGRIDLSAIQLSVVAEPGKNPPSQNLIVTNGGSGDLNPYSWATTSSGGAWLFVVNPTSAEPPFIFQVLIQSASVPPGTYTGAIAIASDIAFNSPQTVAVTLTVRPPSPTIALSPSTLTFSAQPGQDPPSQTFAVNNSDIGTLDWVASVNTAGGGWLTLLPTSGTAPTTVTARVSTRNLMAGTYNGTITITSSSEGIANSPQSLPVSLTIQTVSPPMIVMSSTSLTFTTDQGTNPTAQSITVGNSGGGTLAWTASATAAGGGNWLSVTPLSGSAGDALRVTVNSATLAPGSYAGTITINSSSTGVTNSPQTIPVTLTVRSTTPVITLGATSLSSRRCPTPIRRLRRRCP